MISVIIPTFRQSPYLSQIRADLDVSNHTLETIIVAPQKMQGKIKKIYPKELILFTEKTGRGYQLLEGSKIARGKIFLFLHDDTLLPPAWDTSIIEGLKNKEIIGGAFSLKFNVNNLKFRFLARLAYLFYNLTGELGGDRGIFIRKRILKDNIDVLDIPIMEDIKLSHLMRKKGKTIILKQKVTTDATSFVKKGIFQHTLKIIWCRILLAFNFDPRKIYELYYQQQSTITNYQS